MDLTDYDFALPDRQIARYPASDRDGSRLLAVDRADRSRRHLQFRDLPDLLKPGDTLVVNDAKVFPARLVARKIAGGGSVELLLIRRNDDGCWSAMGKPTRRLKAGQQLELAAGGPTVQIVELDGNGRLLIRFEDSDLSDGELIEQHGQLPLPPYLGRAAEAEDGCRYQTVYARRVGAIAAPTAGLHFTAELLERVRGGGVAVVPLTLLVGPGTFEPIRTACVREHRLEAEWFELGDSAAETICQRKEAGGRTIAVGTTVVRTLETLAHGAAGVRSGCGWSDRFILPPYHFEVVDAMVTNFHLPRSTLLLLVAAFAGRTLLLNTYENAIARGYRFYSYGDAMFIA